MRLALVSTMSLSVLFMMGCASPEPPPPPKKTVFDPLLQTEERAREVQKTVDANADVTRKVVDAQERGDPSP